MKNKILICGGRNFNNYNILNNFVSNIIMENNIVINELEIVSGHCAGADKLGELYAINNNITLKIFPADWEKYGRAAGIIRNNEMIKYIKDNNSIVIGFVCPNSKGTIYTIEEAKKNNLKTYVLNYSFNKNNEIVIENANIK